MTGRFRLRQGLGCQRKKFRMTQINQFVIATKYDRNNPENKGFVSPAITLRIIPEKEFDDLEYENFGELTELLFC